MSDYIERSNNPSTTTGNVGENCESSSSSSCGNMEGLITDEKFEWLNDFFSPKWDDSDRVQVFMSVFDIVYLNDPATKVNRLNDSIACMYLNYGRKYKSHQFQISHLGNAYILIEYKPIVFGLVEECTMKDKILEWGMSHGLYL